jgi:hypothetical protein
MDVKEAVQIAKAHAAKVFEGEIVRLEEVWLEDSTSEWCVTVGLQREEPPSVCDYKFGKKPDTRMHYKTIRIDDATKAVRSVRNHDKMPVSPR